MKTNKLDKNIKEKFANRTFEPSTSAWERLSVKLDEQPQQKKRGWFFYIGAAASILLLVSIGIQLLSNDDSKNGIPKQEIVVQPVDTIIIDKKIDELLNLAPVEEAIVKVEQEQKVKRNVTLTKERSQTKKIHKNEDVVIAFHTNKEIVPKANKKETDVIENSNVIPTKEELKIKEPLKQNPNSRIKINSDDLLYAVTHTKEEVKTYYAKYNIDRDDVLKSIQKQLKKSNLKIDPNTILAEVERDIDEDDFQNNFMKSLKKRVTNIATAIASRNN